MEKKNTDGLQQELMDSPDLEQFLSQNQEQFVNKSVSELLNHLFEKKYISKAALAKQSGMSEICLSVEELSISQEVLRKVFLNTKD